MHILLQTKAGQKAKYQTAEEFFDDMGGVVADHIRGVVRRHRHDIFPGGMSDVKLLFDNSQQHKGALKLGLLDSMGLLEGSKLHHPPYSHEFQAPIEWAFGTIKGDLRRHLYVHRNLRKAGEILKVCEKLWKKRFTAARVQAAFRKQLRTLADIIKADGGRARKRLN